MAFSGIRKEQDREKATIKNAPSATKISKDEAPGHNVDNAMKPTTSISNEKAVAPKAPAITDISSSKKTIAAAKPTISFNSRPKADLMDLDIEQDTTQPVLPFTESGVGEELAHRIPKAPLSFDQQIELLMKSGKLSPTQLKGLRSIQADVHARENANTLMSEAPRPETHTKSELVSQDPKATAPKVTTGIARKFAKQQDAFLIGEHVYKTRYHYTTLTEDFERLRISDPTPVEATAASLPSFENPDKKPISVEKEKSKTNPFGPPPDKGKGSTTADHGAAARVQYSGIGPPADKGKAPSLPPDSLAQSTTADHGAAARKQNSGIGPRADKGKGPSLPPHLLARSTTADHGAAARNQYLGISPPADKGEDPSLLAHLTAQATTTDHKATARDSYSGGHVILSSISNQQSSEDATPSMRPTRRNMINQTGFYALVENSDPVAAEKKGEDPLLVARKRGL